MIAMMTNHMLSAPDSHAKDDEVTVRQRIANATAEARAHQSRLAEERSRKLFRIDEHSESSDDSLIEI